jgi:hypothetical protein
VNGRCGAAKRVLNCTPPIMRRALLLSATFGLATSLKAPPLLLHSHASRRRVILQGGAAAAFASAAAAQGVAAEDSLPAEATFLVPTPLGILSYGLNKQAEEQKACYVSIREAPA